MLAFVFGLVVGLFIFWLLDSPLQKLKDKIALKREKRKHAKKDKIYKKGVDDNG